MSDPKESPYVMPLDADDIDRAYQDWYMAQTRHPTNTDTYRAGYNQGVIDALHYVGKQDQICWDNGYAEAKRELGFEPGVRHVYTDVDGTELACRVVCDTPHGAWFLDPDQIGTCWEARSAQAEYERGVGNGFASAVNRCAEEGQKEYSRGFVAALAEVRAGVIDVMQPEESNGLDFFLGDGNRPICRIVWDDGDEDFDRPARWVLSDDQAGTELETLLVGIGLIERPVLDMNLPPDTDPDFQAAPTPSVSEYPRPGARYYIRVGGQFNPYEAPGAIAIEIRPDRTNWWIMPDGRAVLSIVVGTNNPYCYSESSIAEWIEDGDWKQVDTPFPTEALTVRADPDEFSFAHDAETLSFDTFPKVEAVDAPKGWIAVPDDAMECPVDGDARLTVRLYGDDFPTHETYLRADGWCWNVTPQDGGRITHYKPEPKETCMGYDFPDTARIFKRKHSTGLGKLNYAVIFDDGSGSWVNDEGEVHLMDEVYSMRLDEFETCVQMGLWSEITEADLPPYQVRSENAVAGLEQPWQPWLPLRDDFMRCPVYDGSLMVEVKFRNGMTGVDNAQNWSWAMDPTAQLRIVAYRVPAWKDEPEPELSGESDPTIARLEERIRVLREALVECKTHDGAAAFHHDKVMAHRRLQAINGIVDQALALPPVQ